MITQKYIRRKLTTTTRITAQNKKGRKEKRIFSLTVNLPEVIAIMQRDIADIFGRI